MAQFCKIKPGNFAVFDHDAAPDNEMAQLGGAGTRDRTDQRIVQSKIARMGKVEDRNIGKLARRDYACILEAENAGAIRAAPALPSLRDGCAMRCSSR